MIKPESWSYTLKAIWPAPRKEMHSANSLSPILNGPREQEVQALKNAGASFGPAEKEAFVNSLHLERAEQALGRLKVLSVDFVLPDEHIGNFAAGAFQWAVHAEAQLPDGTICKYALGFEPFKGKLIYTTRM
jgi:hypothetical protein